MFVAEILWYPKPSLRSLAQVLFAHYLQHSILLGLYFDHNCNLNSYISHILNWWQQLGSVLLAQSREMLPRALAAGTIILLVARFASEALTARPIAGNM